LPELLAVALKTHVDGLKKRVLVYEPFVFGSYGNGRFLRSLFRRLEKFEPVLVSPVPDDTLDELGRGGKCVLVAEPPAALRRYGGSILADGVFGKLATACALLWYSGSLAKLIRRLRPEVIHCNNVRGILTIGLAARLTRVPVL